MNRQHCKINWDDELLTIIKKYQIFQLFYYRKFEGQIKLITITKTVNKYYASCYR